MDYGSAQLNHLEGDIMEDFINNNRVALDAMYTEYLYSLYTCDQPLCFDCFVAMVYGTHNQLATMYQELVW